MYNLMFCDTSASFRAKPGCEPNSWHRALGSEPADIAAIEALASDPATEGRIRYLAFRRLRECGRTVPPNELLGVIIEVSFDSGLDTLGAFSEGGVRYVNFSGKIGIVEGVDTIKPFVTRLFDATGTAVSLIGPWKNPRRPPPGRGMIRINFLLSSGLSFGEGPLDVMSRDEMAAPIINRSGELLKALNALNKLDPAPAES